MSILLAVVVVGVVFLAAGRDGDSDPTPTVNLDLLEPSLDKSKGPADAPVVVVEYGDFQ